MTWADVKKTLTTSPPSRPPPPKAPLFTKDFFSTTSFGPGHLVGAAGLVLGIYGLTKFAIWRGQVESQRTLRLAQQLGLPRPPEEKAKVAQVENQRGQYGKTGP